MKIYIILTSLLLTASLLVTAQDVATIDVSGNAQTEISPDIAVFNYNITATARDYEQAIKDLNTRVNQLVSKLKKSGFDSKEIETSNFNISQNNIYSQGKITGKKHIASQSIIVAFDFDEDKLLSVLKNTTSSEVEANLSITFKLSETLKKQTRDNLMKLAVQNAKEKAELLSAASGYKISGIKKISHTGNNNYVSPRTNRMELKTMAIDKSTPTQFDPSDLTVSEQVQISYYIE